ncbi:MAG: response regulator [Proteobacteria bacterium]|nr:response regulator [Pseudomonadota bacterium]
MSTKAAFFIYTLLAIHGIGLANPHPLHASLPAVLEESRDVYELGLHLDILEDPDKKWSIAEVASKEFSQRFTPGRQESYDFGFTSSAYWIRFRLRNDRNERNDWLLEIDPINIDRVVLYCPESNGRYRERETGRFLPLEKRDVRLANLFFHLSLKGKEENTYYLRLESTEALKVSLVLRSTPAALEKTGQQYYPLGMYYGIMLVMFFFNLILFFFVKDRIYLYYVLYLASYTIWQTTVYNFSYLYLWPDFPGWTTRAPPFLASLTIFWVLLFTRSFLKTDFYVPKLHKLLSINTVVAGLMMPLSLILDYFLISVVGGLLVVLSMVLIYTSGWLCLIKKYRPARFFITGWTVLLCGTVANTLENMGILPQSLFTSYSLQIGSALEMVLFSLALADRINLLKQEKDLAQDESIRNQQLAIDNLKKADKIKDEFLANTSHELRTPLHGIMGIAESIMSGAVGEVSPRVGSNLSMIVSSGKRLNNLINDILDLSRLKNRDIALQKKSVDVGSLVDIVLSLTKPLLGEKSIHLDNAIGVNVPLVLADEDRLQQILFNLIGNAVKYTEKGSITVSASNSDGMVTTKVSDTGVGIPADKVQEVFRSFVRVEPQILGENEGTGLGLNISRQLVELHGGKMWIKSTIGSGTDVFFSLPVSTENVDLSTIKGRKNPTIQVPNIVDASGSGKPDASSFELENGEHEEIPFESRLGNSHILTVDDDPLNQQIIANHLKPPAFALEKAYNGRDALAKIRNGKKPDLVLLDIMMPNMSGYEICREIRGIYPPHELPIIFLTARNQVPDLVEGFSLGANDYITKPFNGSELLTRVNNQLNQLKTHERLAALREFTPKIVKEKDYKNIVLEAFRTVYANVHVSQMALFQEGKLLQTKPGQADVDVLKKIPPDTVLPYSISAESEELCVCNNIAPESPLVKFYLEHSGVDIGGCSQIYLKTQGLEEFVVCLHRKPEDTFFDKTDIEYIKTVNHVINTVRGNVNELLNDAPLIEIVNTIHQTLPKILYIKSDSPYCVVHYDNGKKEATSEVIQITMQNLQTYFNVGKLVRIHRSCFVNPDKVLGVDRKNTPDYEAILQPHSKKTIKLNIGRSYLSQLRKTYPTWFAG